MSKVETEAEQGEELTHFGHKQVPVDDKHKLVGQVFHSVADSYDVMNDVMTFGLHRLFKRFVVDLSGVRKGQVVLDLAGGTGEFANAFQGLVGPSGLVFLADINESMLLKGRDVLLDKGVVEGVQYVQANGEKLPFPDDYFDCVTIGYGIRNFTHKQEALIELYRVIKPGGRLLILEATRPSNVWLQKGFDFYTSFWPLAGKMIVGEGDSYQYLRESIQLHPDKETFKSMMEQAEFERVDYYALLGGISTIHRGFKI